MTRGRTLPLVALLALLAPLASGFAVDAAAPAAPEAALRPLRLDLPEDAVDRTVLLEPRHLPAPEKAVGVGPGSRLYVARPGADALCTAAFVYREASRLLLGTAGHCVLGEGQVATHGPGADADLSDVEVRVCVETCNYGGQVSFEITGKVVALGPVVYARQENLDGDGVGHDFALVEIPEALHPLVRPALPVFGGPTAPVGVVRFGTPLCHYGAGSVTGEWWPVMGRVGVASYVGEPEFWEAQTASNSGDSGSPVVACGANGDGMHGAGAAGVLTHGLGTITAGTSAARAVQMARDDAGLSIEIVLAPSA